MGGVSRKKRGWFVFIYYSSGHFRGRSLLFKKNVTLYNYKNLMNLVRNIHFIDLF